MGWVFRSSDGVRRKEAWKFVLVHSWERFLGTERPPAGSVSLGLVLRTYRYVVLGSFHLLPGSGIIIRRAFTQRYGIDGDTCHTQ